MQITFALRKKKHLLPTLNKFFASAQKVLNCSKQRYEQKSGSASPICVKWQSKISVQAVQGKDRILRRGRRHFSASTIECVAHFEFKSKSLQRAIYTLLWYFPLQHFTFHTHGSQDPISPFSAKWWRGVGGGGGDPIMSTKYSNFPSSTQNIASLSSCVESSGRVVSPPHLLIFCPVRLKHGAASMAAQPCDGPFKWAR